MNVEKLIIMPYARVKRIMWALLHLVNLSAWSAQNVLKIRHASIRNALIRAQELVDNMLGVKLLTIIRYVAVLRAILETHSLVVPL